MFWFSSKRREEEVEEEEEEVEEEETVEDDQESTDNEPRKEAASSVEVHDADLGDKKEDSKPVASTAETNDHQMSSSVISAETAKVAVNGVSRDMDDDGAATAQESTTEMKLTESIEQLDHLLQDKPTENLMAVGSILNLIDSESGQLEPAKQMDAIRNILSDGEASDADSKYEPSRTVEAPIESEPKLDVMSLLAENENEDNVVSRSVAAVAEPAATVLATTPASENAEKEDVSSEKSEVTESTKQADQSDQKESKDDEQTHRRPVKKPKERIDIKSLLAEDESKLDDIIAENESKLDDIIAPTQNGKEDLTCSKEKDEVEEQNEGEEDADSPDRPPNGGRRWSFLDFLPKGDEEGHIESPPDDNLQMEAAVVPVEKDQVKAKVSILDAIERIESKNKPAPEIEKISGDAGVDKPVGDNIAGEEKERAPAASAPPNDSFLVNDDLLAKTLSIYEQISKEDELLLESFRATEQTTGEDQEDTQTVSQVDTEPASVAHLKKTRLQAAREIAREISQESRSLFDILDRDFASVTPRVTVNIAGLSRQLTAADVKLCFVAFVSCFSPPIKSHFATEYNYTENDFGAKRGRSRNSDESSVSSGGSGTRSVGSCQDEEPDPERFARPYVPNNMVTALWTDVIRCRFLDRSDITQAIAKRIDSARGEVFAPALAFIRDTLVILGVLDVRKMCSSSSRKDDEEMLSMEETYFVEASRGRKQAVDEVISVHQDIHQEYGEYLTTSVTDENYCSLIDKHEKRWNGVIVDSCSADYRNKTEAGYVVQMLPWNTIRANRFREAASMLAEKKFSNGRLQALGVLEGTTAQVTDAEELVLRHFDKKNAILCFEGIDPDQMMLDAYERIRKDICRQVDDLDQAEDNGSTNQPHRRRLKRLHVATGKALHLMGVSLGAQGFGEQELNFCKQALDLKRNAAFGPSVTIADTLHCVGFSLDNSGAYLEAMEFYNQALAIRRSLLGHQDLRVAETLHNKGAILCENGECNDAMVCLEEALQIRIGHHGEHHESCADTQQWIGNVMREGGRHDEGLRYFQTALKTKKIILGADHEEVANTLQNMAVVLDDMGKYQLSLECYSEALRIYILQFGKEHIRVSDTLQRIAIDYSILEEHEQSLDHFKQAIELREKLLADEICGLSDPKFVVRSLIYPNDVDLDDALGRFGDLIQCYDETLQLTQRLHSKDHESISKILHRLGDLYFETQEYDTAIDSLEEALKSQRIIANKKQLNEEEVCSILYKKGVVHLHKKEYQQAKPCFESVVYRRRKSKTTDLGAEATALYCLGIAFDSLGAYKLSLSAFTEALNAWKEESGESDVRCGYSLYWLGKEEFNTNRFKESVVWCRGALRTFKENKTNVDYAIVAKTLELLGGTHEKLNDNESALSCYSEGIRLVRWKLGENHEFVIDMLCRSGDIKRALGIADEAMELYEDAIFVMKNSDREEDVQLCYTIQTLGLLFQEEGDFDRAKDLLSESYRLHESVLGQEDLRSAGAVLKLGRVLDLQGSHEAAMQCYRETLRVQRTQLNPDHEDVAETLYCMGANLSLCQRHEESIKCFQQALSMQRNAHGDNHLLVARTLHDLATCYKAVGSFDKAIVCYKEALRIFTQNDSSNTEKIAEISFEMAESHEANDNYQAAIFKFKDALNIWRDSGDHDPRLAIVLRKLGLVHLKAGDNEDAVNCLSEALERLEEEDDQSSNGPLLSSTMAGLAKSFSNVGSFDSAIVFYQRHVDLLKSDPSSSEGVSDSLYAMGTIYARLSNLDDAITHFKECLLVRKNTFGGTDERVARVLINMGVVFEKQEEFGSAKDCFAEAVRIYKVNDNERDASSSLQDLGRTLMKQGALDTALESYSEALQISKKIVGSNDPQVASLHYICGTTLYDKGDFDKALTSFRESVKIRRKMGSESKETAEAVCMVGQTLVKLGEYEESIDSLNEALGSLLLIKGEESLDVANCHHALGLAFSAKGDHEEAVAHFRKAVLPRQRYFGEESVEVSSTYFELGEGYSTMGEWGSAVKYAVNALRIRKIVLGTDNLEYAESLSQLGDIQLALLKLTEALSCYVEALKVFSAVEGRGHVTVAQCLEKIASIYLGQDQQNEAIESLKRAMKIYTESLGGLTSQVAIVLLSLGKAEVQKESPDNAITYFRQSLQISKELNEDMAVAAALYEIGTVLEGKGKRGEAMECYKETLHLAVDADSAMTRAKTFNKIGGLLADQEKLDDAMKACEKALALFRKVQGEPVVEMGETYEIIAGIHSANGEYDKSLDFFQKAHKILVDRLGPNALSVALSLNNLSINHARRRDFPKAFDLCSEALGIRREKLGADHLDTCDTLYNIANILDEWGKIDEAMKYYTEALESYRCTLGTEDLEVANCFQYVGALHLKKEEDDKAMRAFVESLRIYQIHDEESTGMATILFNLGKIYNQQKDYDKGLETLAYGLRIQKAESSDKSEIAATCDQIGVSYAGKELRTDAKKFFQKALTMYMDCGKQDTVENAKVLAHFASVLSDEEAFDEALKLFHDTLQIFNRDVGENSDEVAATLVKIGIIHNKRVDYEEALRLLTSALKIRSALFGRDDMKVAETLFEIGKVMEEWGDSEEVSSHRL
jgi:tetratricopeptide (TPR) repeat protein